MWMPRAVQSFTDKGVTSKTSRWRQLIGRCTDSKLLHRLCNLLFWSGFLPCWFLLFFNSHCLSYAFSVVDAVASWIFLNCLTGTLSMGLDSTSIILRVLTVLLSLLRSCCPCFADLRSWHDLYAFAIVWVCGAVVRVCLLCACVPSFLSSQGTPSLHCGKFGRTDVGRIGLVRRFKQMERTWLTWSLGQQPVPSRRAVQVKAKVAEEEKKTESYKVHLYPWTRLDVHAKPFPTCTSK